MLVVVLNFKDLCRIVIFHAETIIVIVHWVVKGVQVIFTYNLWLLLLLLWLLRVSIFSVGRSNTRATRSAPEITIDLFRHLISTRGCSPPSSSHHSSLEVEVARHQSIQANNFMTLCLSLLRNKSIFCWVPLRGVERCGASLIAIIVLQLTLLLMLLIFYVSQIALYIFQWQLKFLMLFSYFFVTLLAFLWTAT